MATIRGTDYSDRIYQDDLVAVDIYGYGGNDSIYLNRTDSRGGGNFVDAGSGRDTVVNYFEGDNDIYLGSGNDTYIADIRAVDVDAYDVVHGEEGNDLFEVNSEQSKYYGDSGNDTFRSTGFNNYFNGGSGVDTISYVLQDDDRDQAGQGVEIDLADGTAYIKQRPDRGPDLDRKRDGHGQRGRYLRQLRPQRPARRRRPTTFSTAAAAMTTSMAAVAMMISMAAAARTT